MKGSLRIGKAKREKALVALATLGDPPKPVAYVAKRRRISRWMSKRGWGHKTPRDGLRRRLYCLSIERHRWWDWGHRVMILVGTDDGGNWASPEPPTWWYRLGKPKHMWRTGYPLHPLSTFEVITDYDTFRTRTEGLNDDQMYEWQAIYVGEDGHSLSLGHRYWGSTFYDMNKPEVALLRRYLRMWRRHDWYGLRSWLYSQALHAAVHQRRPFRCGITPPRGTGGYSHWHCGKKKKHLGDHRFNNYTWPGGEEKVVYEPR